MPKTPPPEPGEAGRGSTSCAEAGRGAWDRSTPLLALTEADVATLVAPVFPGKPLRRMAYTEGGLANTNLRVWFDRDESVLVRLYTRDQDVAAKEIALLEKVRPTVPVPTVRHHAGTNPVTGHPYAIFDWIDGHRLDLTLAKTPEAEARQLGRSVGETLAGIHGHTFVRTGSFGQDLEPAGPLSLGREGLADDLGRCLTGGPGRARLGEDLAERVLRFVASEGRVLDDWDGPPCLSHCDFGGSNLIVRQRARQWLVSGVLDWEFAIAGHPFFDFANLLRFEAGRNAAFVKGLTTGYHDQGGHLPADWRRKSLLSDWFAWAQFLNRPSLGDGIIADARRTFVETMRHWPELDQA